MAAALTAMVGCIDVVPDWFSAGEEVPCVFKRSPDAEFVLDGDFASDYGVLAADLAWRECIVPIEAFGVCCSNLREHIARLSGTHVAKQIEAELCRCQHIQEWIEAAGGIDVALNQSPLLVTLQGGQILLQDGYHRLGLATFNYSAKTVKALCAYMPNPGLGNFVPERCSRHDVISMSNHFV